MKYQKLPVLLSGVLAGSAPDSTDAIITAYLFRHMHDPDISISAIAEDCHVGLATVSRYVRNLGFENFYELRESMRMEAEPVEIISREEDPVETVISSYDMAVKQCLRTLDTKAVEQLCDEIDKARKIYVFGLLKGESAAMCLSADLLGLGKDVCTAVSYSDQLKYIREAEPDDLIILFSATCSYFEYADTRRIRHLLENRNIHMIGSGTPPEWVRHCIGYEAGDIPLSHPVQLLSIAQTITQIYVKKHA